MISRIFGGVGRSLIFSGTVLLLFVGYQLWGTSLDTQGHQRDLTREFGETVGVDPDKPKDEALRSIVERLSKIEPRTAEPLEAPAEGEGAGFIEIPKIDLGPTVFVQGVSKADLRKGPGHYTGTPFPGNEGNAGIAGHRTTYSAPFNRIDELVPGDHIIVYTNQGKFTYEVRPSPDERRSGEENRLWGPGWFAVRPSDVSVLDQSDENMLTLTACHPKRSARYRIIVQATLIADPAPAPDEDLDPSTSTVKPENSETVGSDSVDEEAAMIAGDPDELAPAIAWFAAVVAIWLASMAFAAFLRRRQRRAWWIYLFTVALSAWPLWLSFTHVDKFLPSF